MLRKVDPSSNFCNKFFQLATLKFVAWKVEHAVVIQATTSFTCNATTMLRDKLNENVARITWPLRLLCCFFGLFSWKCNFFIFCLQTGSYCVLSLNDLDQWNSYEHGYEKTQQVFFKQGMFISEILLTGLCTLVSALIGRTWIPIMTYIRESMRVFADFINGHANTVPKRLRLVHLPIFLSARKS